MATNIVVLLDAGTLLALTGFSVGISSPPTVPILPSPCFPCSSMTPGGIVELAIDSVIMGTEIVERVVSVVTASAEACLLVVFEATTDAIWGVDVALLSVELYVVGGDTVFWGSSVVC